MFHRQRALRLENASLREGLARLSEGFGRLQTGFQQLQERNQHLSGELQHLTEENERLRKALRPYMPPQDLDALLHRQQPDQAPVGLPGIVFNTLPKSGSVFIASSLAKGLGIPIRTISHGYFPQDIVDQSRLRTLAQGNALTQEHLDASPMNLQLLCRFLDRMVLHVRDPRQSTLSWTHHLARLKREGQEDMLYFVYPAPPRDYLELQLSAQIDWNLDHYLPACIRWLQDWLHAIDRLNGVRILVTTYEEFLADQEAFIQRVLGFYDIPPERFTRQEVPKDLSTNFRKGDPEEWQQQFTVQQREKALAQLPADLRLRFGWSD